jgi:hypothetical protein
VEAAGSNGGSSGATKPLAPIPSPTGAATAAVTLALEVPAPARAEDAMSGGVARGLRGCRGGKECNSRKEFETVALAGYENEGIPCGYGLLWSPRGLGILWASALIAALLVMLP